MVAWILNMCFQVFLEQVRTAKIIVIEKQKKRSLGAINAVIPSGGQAGVGLVCIPEWKTWFKRLNDFSRIVRRAIINNDQFKVRSVQSLPENACQRLRQQFGTVKRT